MAADDPSKKYDQAFFLNLAAKGKDAWNAWRRDPANEDRHVTFAGIDFSEEPRDGIDFSGFEFGDDTDFSGCEWCGVDWEEMKKDPKAFKTGRASFASAVFGNGVDFTDVVFGDSAVFDGAAFGNDTSFNGAAFGWGARFVGTIFKGDVEFMGTPKEQSKRHEGSGTGSDSGPDGFLTISFANARFDWEAVFSGRSFEADADFTNARFYYPPDFDAVAKASRIDFTGAHIGFVRPNRLLHWTYKTTIPVRLRALRKIAEETKNHDLERDLYIEERKAERGVYLSQLFKERKNAPMREWPLIAARLLAHLLWITAMSVYWALADYGRSFVRPLAALIITGFVFYWGYTKVLAQLMATAPDFEKYKHAVRMLALGNAVPFVGPLTIDAEIKKFLFCPGGNCPGPLIPPEGYQWLVLGQNLVSIILVFFIGLALRNYFRIK